LKASGGGAEEKAFGEGQIFGATSENEAAQEHAQFHEARLAHCGQLLHALIVSGDDADLPDVRDGLTRLERAILTVLSQTQKERGGGDVPTAMLYGRVVELVNVSPQEFLRALQRLIGR
jgi:hypothetical protein